MEPPPSKPEIRDRPDPGGRVGDDGGGVLQPEDRRLQAATFLLALGCSTIIYGTVLNGSANPEHVFLGLVLFTVGTVLALLTLGGGGRIAARIEEFLRDFF